MEDTSILLYGVAKAHGRPSGSGFCQKLESFLRLTGVKYDYHFTLPFSAPRGKVPYIVHGSTIVPDSSIIIEHLITSGVASDPDNQLSAVQRADSRAWQGLIEESLCPMIAFERWIPDSNFQIFKDQIIGDLNLPWIANPFVAWYLRRAIRTTLYYKGAGRQSVEDNERFMQETVEALACKYAESPTLFVHGTEQPSRLDATVYGFLSSAIDSPQNPTFTDFVLRQPKLVQFCIAMTQKLFPEYEALLNTLRKKTM